MRERRVSCICRPFSSISKLCWGLNTDHVDVIEVSKKVIAGVYNGVTTVELDQLAAEACPKNTRKVAATRLTMMSRPQRT